MRFCKIEDSGVSNTSLVSLFYEEDIYIAIFIIALEAV